MTYQSGSWFYPHKKTLEKNTVKNRLKKCENWGTPFPGILARFLDSKISKRAWILLQPSNTAKPEPFVIFI